MNIEKPRTNDLQRLFEAGVRHMLIQKALAETNGDCGYYMETKGGVLRCFFGGVMDIEFAKLAQEEFYGSSAAHQPIKFMLRESGYLISDEHDETLRRLQLELHDRLVLDSGMSISDEEEAERIVKAYRRLVPEQAKLHGFEVPLDIQVALGNIDMKLFLDKQ